MSTQLISSSFIGKYSKVESDENQLHLFIKNKIHESFNWKDIENFTTISSNLFGSSFELIFNSTPLKLTILSSSDCKKKSL